MKIKFRALCLTALVVVLAFASVASAATFVGATRNGTVQTFTVDLSDGGTPLSRKANVSLAPGLLSSADRNNALKFFGVPGKVFAVSTDTAGAQSGSNLYEFTVDANGTPAYSKTIAAPALVFGMNGRGASDARTHGGNGVKRVIEFKDNPVFIGESAFAVLLNDTNLKSLDISVDLAFVHNDKLYVVNSNTGNAISYIQVASDITLGTNSTDIADILIGTRNPGKSELLSYPINGQTKIPWKDTNARGSYSTVVTEKYVYLATEAGVYKINVADTDVLHSPKVDKTVLQGEFLAMVSEGETIYAWKRMGGTYYLVSIATETDAETELHRMTADEWDISSVAVAPSFDICYNPSDKVIGVVAHASPMAGTSGLAVFIPSETNSGKWDLFNVDSEYQSAALLASKSNTTPDTPDTPSTPTTTVDINTLDSGVASKIASTMGTDASKFVTATVASKTSTTSAAEAAVKTAFGDTNAKVTALGSYTPSAEGFILVSQSIAYGKKAYFVDESILAADSTGLNSATLLDSNGDPLTSGNSTYVAGGSLDANKAYTLVTAETDTSKEEDTGSTTSSSSGGCDAGFGLMSLAALLAVSTISKRR